MRVFVMNEKPKNRRDFLSAAVGLAVAGPALAAAAAPSSGPAHDAGVRGPGGDGVPHDPAEAEDDACDCRTCRTARFEAGKHPLLHAAVSALAVAQTALERFVDEEPGPGEKCPEMRLAADGYAFAVEWGFQLLDGSTVGWERPADEAPASSVTAAESAIVALVGALDALSDMVAGHRESGARHLCRTADRVLFHVAEALQDLDDNWPLDHAADVRVAERQLLSAERKLARVRKYADCLLPHTDAAHCDAEGMVESRRRVLRLLRLFRPTTPCASLPPTADEMKRRAAAATAQLRARGWKV
jgi:hypothetical protein